MADTDRTDTDAAAAAPLRARLVRGIVADGGLTDTRWRAAFEEVPRHLFVPAFYRPRPGGGYTRLAADDGPARDRARWLAGVYEDQPLVTHVRNGRLMSSSSQPSLMAVMLEALAPDDGQSVLEVGTGTGYNAALLAHRLGGGAVTAVDIEPAVTEAARTHLAAAGVDVHAVTADGAAGCPQCAPYDRVIATCELPAVPPAWLGQCRPGARIVAPVVNGLVSLLVTSDRHAEGRFLPTAAYFLSLRGTAAVLHPVPESVGPDERVRSSDVPPGALEDDVFRFLLTMAAGELDIRWAFGGRGVAVIAADGSAARADRDGTVLLAGPRDLWSLVEQAHALWQDAGRPGRERFGLTVDGPRQWTWLDDPDGPHTWEL